MRKRLTGRASLAPERKSPGAGTWWDLDRLARVEVTSEAPDHPIEAALVDEGGDEWRALDPGPQTVRLVFDEPQHLQRVQLSFEEHESPRTHEFVLRWSPDDGRSFRDIVRQQWTFSPPGTVREVEEYRVDALNLTVLELTIVPDISGGAARASLAGLRLG